MQYNQLGSSSLSISEIGFGCMSIGAGNDNSTSLIHEAIDVGINYFDTADLYDKGLNETALGKALKGRRDKVVLATKAGKEWRPDGSGWNWNPAKNYILSAVEKSLVRLQTDHIDLYQLHGGTIEDPIDETIEAFEILKKQGKILYYGISSVRPNVIQAYAQRSSITSVMMQYSLLDRRPEESCLDLLKKKNIGVLARGALAQGLLVNKPSKPYLDLTTEQVEKAAAAIHSLTVDARDTAQSAILFALHHPAISSALIGIRNREQLVEAVKTSSAPRLNNEEVVILQNSVKAGIYKDHRN